MQNLDLKLSPSIAWGIQRKVYKGLGLAVGHKVKRYDTELCPSLARPQPIFYLKSSILFCLLTELVVKRRSLKCRNLSSEETKPTSSTQSKTFNPKHLHPEEQPSAQAKLS